MLDLYLFAGILAYVVIGVIFAGYLYVTCADHSRGDYNAKLDSSICGAIWFLFLFYFFGLIIAKIAKISYWIVKPIAKLLFACGQKLALKFSKSDCAFAPVATRVEIDEDLKQAEQEVEDSLSDERKFNSK